MVKQNIPYEIINLAQGTDEWKWWRRHGFGASESARVFSAQSMHKLIYAKKNDDRNFQNAAMLRGHELEPVARQTYCVEVGFEVKPLCIQSIESPWIRASLDGISDDGQRIVEIKCGQRNYEHVKSTGEVPKKHYGQLQHLMMITGLKTIDYWAYDPDDSGILIAMQSDAEYIHKLGVELRRANELLEKEKPFVDPMPDEMD